jgi:hypothetical protein
VAFFAVASRRDSAADITRYTKAHHPPFPVLRDVGGVAASHFGAARSPEAFVIDGAGRVRYRGRIDDQHTPSSRRPAPTRQELRDAIEAVLAGKEVRVSVTDAPGCPLPVEEALRAQSNVTYCHDVAPILQRRCQTCHRPGQSGPFSLLTYRSARSWAGAIREVIQERRMPPWGADPRYGKFANDPSLTAAEKATLISWIDGACPEGDPKDMPPPRRFPAGWEIGEPDLVVEMPKEFTVPARGTVEYQYIRVDPGFREDRWVTAAEIRAGNPAVVHHVNIFLQPPGYNDPHDVFEQGPLGSFCLTMMAQGTPPMVLGAGRAKHIPAGWRIVFVVHYQAVGSVQKDRTRLGLRFAAPGEVHQEVATRLINTTELHIPPRAADHRVVRETEVHHDVLLLSLFPHLHLRGKSFRYEVVHPDGREEVILDVPRFDFAWQHRYELAEPMRVKAGSVIRCTAVYDNSADNPANPNPDVEVRAGPQSWDEMFNGYFDVCLADEDLARHDVPWGRWAIIAVSIVGILILARKWAGGK